MPDGPVLAGAILQVATAAAAAYGAYRCVQLQRFASDSRLRALAWFFALFAGALVLQAVWQVQVGAGGPGFGRAPQNFTAPPPGQPFPFIHPEGTEQVNIVLTLSHALMLASLTVGVWAFGHRRKPDEPQAAVPPGALALLPIGLAAGLVDYLDDLVPLMLALEAGLALYLAARGFINHVERRSSGALQVALGFLFFFVAHLVIYVNHQPGAGHDRLGDVLSLVGIVLLVQVLPRSR